VEDSNRARMSVEQLPEVRLAQPAVDPRAHLDADDVWDDRRASDPLREIDLAEAAFAEQPFDAVLELRLRTRDDAIGREKLPRSTRRSAKAGQHSGRGGGGMLQHTNTLHNRRSGVQKNFLETILLISWSLVERLRSSTVKIRRRTARRSLSQTRALQVLKE